MSLHMLGAVSAVPNKQAVYRKPVPSEVTTNPSQVEVSPHNLATTKYTNVAYVQVTGGNPWVPQWQPNARIYDTAPVMAVIVMKDKSRVVPKNIQSLTVYDGSMKTIVGARGTSSATAAPKDDSGSDSWLATAATLAGGAIGLYLGSRFPILGREHPVLGLINGMAIAGNVTRVATKEITPRRAIENMASHTVATAGALALASHPLYSAIGYIAGAAGSNVFIRRKDTYLERLDETVIGSAKRFIGASWLPAPSLAAVRGGVTPVKKGQQGDSVTYVQGIVGDSAYASTGFTADGKFGDATEAAVKKFQAAKSLPSTGVVDQATIAAMDAVSGGGGVPVVDLTKPAPTSTAMVPVKKGAIVAAEGESETDAEGEALLFGRPLWQVILALAGFIIAGGMVYAGVKD